MTRKKTFLSIVICFIFLSASIFGEPLRKRINPYGSMILDQLFSLTDESAIPLPEVQYELPETLVGDFFMVSSGFDHIVTIFPNNKYISFTYVPDEIYFINESYGHIVKIDGKWYFSPMPKTDGYIRKLTEISITESGFSYCLNERWILTSMRRENIPVPVHLAEEITIPWKIKTKQQYFIFNDPAAGRIDFSNIEVPVNGYNNTFMLRVDNGIVKIYTLGDNGVSIAVGSELFEGFIEKKEEINGVFKGIIKFTNGPPYYYIKNGVAEIETNSDGNIIITMLYSPSQETLNRIEVPEGVRFPAKLVLEF